MPRTWLASTKGTAADRLTQRWVQLSGRSITVEECPWLIGPVGNPRQIGTTYFEELAATNRLTMLSGPGAGLIGSFELLRSETFDPGSVTPAVRCFYEHTANYELDAWSEWSGIFRPFGWMLSRLFSRRLQQLNVPLRPLDTSRGIESRILELRNASGEPVYTAWLRHLVSTGDVLYAGIYSTCNVPGFSGACVKVVFPLPNGNAVVIMRPEVQSTGSFALQSVGERFGDPGFYLTVHSAPGIRARYVKAMQESIKVYADQDGKVRADHVLRFCGSVFLRLHYRLQERTK